MNIGVISAGPKKDFIRALPDLARIHDRHKNDHILLAVHPENADLAGRTGYFNKIWAVDVPPRKNFLGRWLVKRRLASFDCDKYYLTDAAQNLHLPGEAPPDKGPVQKGWVKTDLSFFQLPRQYVVLDLHHNTRTIPQRRISALAQKLVHENLTPVYVGAASDQEAAERISRLVSEGKNLCGQLNDFECAALAHQAQLWIGYNTAPAWLAAFTGCKTLCLYDADEDTDAGHIPTGKNLIILQKELEDVRVGEIYQLLQEHEYL